MKTRLELEILPQPSLTTCGPTCLHAVYGYFEDTLDLETVIDEITSLDGGGTLAVFLAIHALRRGYRATIYTYNLKVFDPTWFRPGVDIRQKLEQQLLAKPHKQKLRKATKGYLEFLRLGGELRFEDLRPKLIRRFLNKGIPILTGLSATYLYQSARELPNCEDDDVAGEAAGHFVVLHGYDRESRLVRVADPLADNPVGEGHYYEVGIERVISSILLGILTYDSNLLIIRPRDAVAGDGDPADVDPGDNGTHDER